MHPGWACFLSAFGSGLLMGIGLVITAVEAGRGGSSFGGPAFFFGLSIILMIIAARKAERLWERT